MPFYHQPGPQAQDRSTPTSASSQHAAYGAQTQLDSPADYRPQMVPFNGRNGHSQPSSQGHHQQRVPPQQWRQQQSQHPQIRARPMHPANAMAPHAPAKQHKPAGGSAVTTLLPYCTADVPLNESQVLAVTDVAGSLKELVLLALGAKDGGAECASRLRSALGSEQAVAGILDFFSGEFEFE
ncbi:uncharacterized protein M421DRAFT_89531 [Didymella exigua CBS 183.55]|uniref:Uncharacterized protein n=1 Tax=Didymella exigua CBS 183.55 TaxID=1150837 RepID=A0A6A5RY91_9PLEO|nr:uncharacterized protein M421DRAFT_89531 [Didymella exigua CBS 183.55]KAF1932184.1 hypothetical protein M421DRAFT_89531 [Didymella exigua CBS 183.55]